MQKIGKLSLKNNGGFVARLEFEFYNDSSSKWIHVCGTSDITLGFAKTANPGDFGVPDGSMVRLHVYVAWGTNNVSKEMFLFEKGCADTAKFAISGTTLNNHLEYRGIESGLLSASVGSTDDALEASPAALFDFASLTDDEISHVKASLENPSLAQNGCWGPLSWVVNLDFDPENFMKSGVDVKISLLTVSIIDARLDAQNPNATADLTVAGIGVKAGLGIDFAKRAVYLKGKLNFVFYSKEFDLTILSF